jgi:hypothetical protein
MDDVTQMAHSGSAQDSSATFYSYDNVDEDAFMSSAVPEHTLLPDQHHVFDDDRTWKQDGFRITSTHEAARETVLRCLDLMEIIMVLISSEPLHAACQVRAV